MLPRTLVVVSFLSLAVAWLPQPLMRGRQPSALPRRRMGLYDDPLPPRPPPRPKKEPKPSNNDDDDDEYMDLVDAQSPARLFSFTALGVEKRNLLPRLGRRLDTGIGCYFEAGDRKVQNLVEKTSCAVEDACWALEACKGDVGEAWMCISTARRMLLNSERGAEGVDLDVYELEMEDDFQESKQRRLDAQKKRNVEDFFKGGGKDERWLPKENPRPVDDEPWFTG